MMSSMKLLSVIFVFASKFTLFDRGIEAVLLSVLEFEFSVELFLIPFSGEADACVVDSYLRQKKKKSR